MSECYLISIAAPSTRNERVRQAHENGALHALANAHKTLLVGVTPARDGRLSCTFESAEADRTLCALVDGVARIADTPKTDISWFAEDGHEWFATNERTYALAGGPYLFEFEEDWLPAKDEQELLELVSTHLKTRVETLADAYEACLDYNDEHEDDYAAVYEVVCDAAGDSSDMP